MNDINTGRLFCRCPSSRHVPAGVGFVHDTTEQSRPQERLKKGPVPVSRYTIQHLVLTKIRCRETHLKGLSEHVMLFRVTITLQGHWEKSGLEANTSMGPMMQLGHAAGGGQVTSSGLSSPGEAPLSSTELLVSLRYNTL